MKLHFKYILFVFFALISAGVNAEEKHLIVIDDGFKSTHGLAYSFTSKTLRASGPKHRTDQFGDNPYEISLAAFFSEDAVVMLHAERVANQSGASNYENLDQAKWPDASFRSSGAVCIDVSASDIQGEHDLEWLRDHGFEPVGPLAYAQFFATTADHNDEIVVTMLARISSCETGQDIEATLLPLKTAIDIKRVD
jgi:hypothetical protein